MRDVHGGSLARGLVRTRVGHAETSLLPACPHVTVRAQVLQAPQDGDCPFLYTVTQSSWWFSHTAQ